MRVLHLCWSYPSEWFPAEGSFFRNMIEPLREMGVDVSVVTPMSYVPKLLGRLAPRFRRAAALPLQYEYRGVRVFVPRHVRLPKCLAGDLLPAVVARAVASAVDQRPEIVHAHFAYPFGAAAVQLGRRWDVPVVLTIHGSDGYAVPYESKGNRRRFVQTVLGVDRVLVVSNQLAGCVRDLAGREAEFWPIGVDLDRFSQSAEDKLAVRRRLKLPQSGKLLLFVGHLTTGKGVDLILALMDRLPPDVRLVAIGVGPLSHLLSNNPRYTCISAVSNPLVLEYMRAADLLVLPSRAEGTPTVVVEAGAARLPVVASAVGGIPDLLADDRGVLVKPGSVEGLVTGVRMALDDSQAGAERARRLGSFIGRKYDCRANARRLVRLYAQLIASRSRGERPPELVPVRVGETE